MKRILVGAVVAVMLAGCTTNPLAILFDRPLDVVVEAKVVKGSGEVIPVANTKFTYAVYDASYTAQASSSFVAKAEGVFTTDFEGKANVNIPEGVTLVSGYYSILGGSSNIIWSRAPIKVTRATPKIRLSNDNGTVYNF